MSKNNHVLACFDFDGTITRKDTLFDFFLYTFGACRLYSELYKFLPILLGYAVGLVPNDIAKEHLISGFLQGMPYEQFIQHTEKYALFRIDEILHPLAMPTIQKHQEAGHEIVVVSASIEEWIRPWCESKNIRHVFASRLEQKDFVLTGKFSTKNCNGQEKVRRIQEHFDLKDFEQIYAYGDSAGDNEMIAIADIKFYRWRQIC